jgi:decaprenylphospho-beta-D-ribofuranose 2-oxidase
MVVPPDTPKLLTIPKIPINLVKRPLIKVFNSIRYFRLKALSTKGKIEQSIWEVLFPSDLFNFWNRLFGPKGLMEYQFVFEHEKGNEVEELLREIARVANPALCAVKILGPKNNCYMSFPSSGFLVGVTFPWKKSLAPFVHLWDRRLVDLSSRKYLSKDVLTRREVIEVMYPEFQTFLRVCEKYDPKKKIQSDLKQRLMY